MVLCYNNSLPLKCNHKSVTPKTELREILSKLYKICLFGECS